jgi:hypothetical protein
VGESLEAWKENSAVTSEVRVATVDVGFTARIFEPWRQSYDGFNPG